MGRAGYFIWLVIESDSFSPVRYPGDSDGFA